MTDVKELRELREEAEEGGVFHGGELSELLDALKAANDLIERQANRLDEVHDMLGDEQSLRDNLDFISKQNVANYKKLQAQIAEISQTRKALEAAEELAKHCDERFDSLTWTRVLSDKYRVAREKV